jgi:hypothetical protein
MYSNVKAKQAIPESMKISLFDLWLLEIWEMHTELNNYKQKRKDRKSLMLERLKAPQTKTMKKKIKRYCKKDLENVK